MRVIIFDNFLNFNYQNISRILVKWIRWYKEIKLKSFIIKLKKTYGPTLKIKVISTRMPQYRLGKKIQTETASDYRINIDREEFLKIKKKGIENVRNIIINTYNNLRTSSGFYLEGIFLGKLIEYGFAAFLKQVLGEIEILKKILEVENFDKGILFDFNPKLLLFIKNLYNNYPNLEAFNDSILKKVKKTSLWHFSKYVLSHIGFTIKNYLQGTIGVKTSLIRKDNTILFITNTGNQFESIKPIYKYFYIEKDYGVILYNSEYTIRLRTITKLLNFAFQIRNVWLKNPNKKIVNLNHESIKLKNLLEEYYKFEMFFASIKAFNNLANFKKILATSTPILVVLADELQAEARLYTKYCRINKIPTLYIPHAGIPDYPDLSERNDFNYIAVPGELDKKYLIKKGVQSENIFITGRTRYEKYYKREVGVINEVKDIFSNNVYKFKPNKFTILYITSNLGIKSSREFNRKVFYSIKKLNLVNNLVIKIHPAQSGHHHKEVLDELKIQGPVIVKDYDILELIKSSDLILSQPSYTVLESMIIGIPTILLDFINTDFYFSGSYKFFEEKDLITVKNQRFLIEAIKKLINDKEFYNKYSQKLIQLAKGYLYYNSKKTATENIISLIKMIIQNNKESGYI